MDSQVLHFFFDELEKTSSASGRKRHQYYMRNRTQILNRQRLYRQKNRAKIMRRQKMYRRRVSMGSQRVRKRHSMGNSYTYGGYR